MTNLTRQQLRRMGLNNAGVRRLFEEASATSAIRDGCDCGLLFIRPSPGRKTNEYDVEMYHEATCPAHPVNAEKRAERERRRLVNRLRRFLRARRP